MTTNDENTDDVVGSLFREVDDHFADLEQQYNDARRHLAGADEDRREREVDYVQATADRYELMSEVASLRSDLSRSVEALAERDRILAELTDRIGGFEEQLRQGEQAKTDARAAQQALAEEKREVSRLNALLEARLAERQELTDLAHRLQADKEHVEDLLATSLARFEQVDRVRHEVTDKLGRIEAVRQNETAEYESRAAQLAEAKAEVTRLSSETAELVKTRDEAEHRANRAEGLVERRSNEISYLNRRIEALSADAGKADGMGDEIAELTRTNTLLNRNIQQLESQLKSQVAETEASSAAVSALAERSSERDELAAKVQALEHLLKTQDASREKAKQGEQARVSSTDEIATLTERVRNLESPESFAGSLSPTTRLDVDLPQAEQSADHAPATEVAAPATEVAAPATEVAEQLKAQTVQTPIVEVAVVEAEVTEAAVPEAAVTEAEVVEAEIELNPAEQVAVEQLPGDQPALPTKPAAAMIDSSAANLPSAPQFDLFAPAADLPQAPVAPNFAAEIAATAATGSVSAAPAFSFGATTTPGNFVARRRIVLPAATSPDSEQAVALYLSQENAIVIVDARSSCTQTGMRPSELFERIVSLRDRFDVPIEVVVTPVSTPVGGAPAHAAVGIHTVTGADTVSDRVRALCLGLPGDQPIVVIAADDHVRRAAIAEEANVIEPSAVLELTTF